MSAGIPTVTNFFFLSFAPDVCRVARSNCSEVVASVAGFLAAIATPWRGQPWPRTKQARNNLIKAQNHDRATNAMGHIVPSITG